MQVYKPATAENGRAEVMFLRHYSHGTLQKETVLRVAEQDLRRQELKDKPKMRRAEKHAAVQVCCGLPGPHMLSETSVLWPTHCCARTHMTLAPAEPAVSCMAQGWCCTHPPRVHAQLPRPSAWVDEVKLPYCLLPSKASCQVSMHGQLDSRSQLTQHTLFCASLLGPCTGASQGGAAGGDHLQGPPQL